jgi:hypothetical protein
MVDVENLAGTASPTQAQAAAVAGLVAEVIQNFDGAQVVIACSHHAALVVAFAFRSARQLWRSGPNGADLALLEVLETERVDERFQYVTVCSGDGIFSDVVAWLGSRQVEVTVVALRGHLSTRLRLAARHVHEVPVALVAVEAGGLS